MSSRLHKVGNMSKQFELVDCRRGAPMGRSTFGEAREVSNGRIELFRVRFVDGDYDDGGAYWGGYPSLSLYCARTGDGSTYRNFARAKSRKEAAEIMEIPFEKLKRGFNA